MFKRVEKRRRKQQEEEELGLDEEIKQILGIQDTDSEESGSDSDDPESAQDEDDEDEDDGEDGGFGGFDDELSGDEDEEGSSAQGDTNERSPITVQEALRDPLYIVSLQPVVKACIACPGKLLKSSTMVDLHKKSNAHERRVKQFEQEAKKYRLTDNAWDVLDNWADKKPTPALGPEQLATSKRAEKKKSYAANRKAKREKQKAKAKKVKAAPPGKTDPLDVPAGQAQKRQKVQESQAPPPTISQAPDEATKLTTSGTAKQATKTIVRSVSDRAKLVRARAENATAAHGKAKKKDTGQAKVLKRLKDKA